MTDAQILEFAIILATAALLLPFAMIPVKIASEIWKSIKEDKERRKYL